MRRRWSGNLQFHSPSCLHEFSLSHLFPKDYFSCQCNEGWHCSGWFWHLRQHNTAAVSWKLIPIQLQTDWKLRVAYFQNYVWEIKTQWGFDIKPAGFVEGWSRTTDVVFVFILGFSVSKEQTDGLSQLRKYKISETTQFLYTYVYWCLYQ